MSKLRIISAAYALILLGAAGLGHVPGLTDAGGRVLGVFALTIHDHVLHIMSALWAALAAWLSHRAARFFLFLFGILYCGDGLLGVVTGSGYLDLGILLHGVQSLPIGFKIVTNLPRLGLGAAAFASSMLIERAKA